MKPLLEIRHLSYSYHSAAGETYALADLSFQVEKGEFIAVVGPSGCGKSTLLSLISGLLIPEQGEILLSGAPVAVHKSAIGYMLQKDQLLEWRNIYQNVTLGLEIQHKMQPGNIQKINQMLLDYGLFAFRNAKPSQLSGGMRQRAALIRTLALDPDLLLLDEPFSALDYLTRISVCDDIYCILKKEKKTAVLVTHDLSEAISVADRILVLTSRPASIRRIIDIKLNIPERTPLASRNAPEFKNYFNQIWKELT
ncbi:MAG: ABC transporter ATP-binding protein [Lachnospiraceae bacterium]|nr:ABC transporter ATP-binding protein [Lachnospiraceae bacterium]MDD3795340.1 ABC transporter ATP-binding protein [Lachnospiraceae bacterium]